MTFSVTFDGKTSWKSCICKLEQGRKYIWSHDRCQSGAVISRALLQDPLIFLEAFSHLRVENSEHYFGSWLPENAVCSAYSNVSQASSFHWPGPGGLLVKPGSGLPNNHLIVFISGRINTLKKTPRLISWACLSPLSVLLVSVTVDRVWNPEVPPWQE